MSPTLLDQESHFAFGENWDSYSKLVTEARIERAVEGLSKLAGREQQGKRFLDIGCGSGLHSLAALRLGAAEVVSVDLDADSVATTRRLLEANVPNGPWKVLERSVFDLDRESLGTFDVVYSWGVLHHTGDMYRALRLAATLVAPGGVFAFALYRRTRLCWFWRLEKKWYAKAGPTAQRAARLAYIGLYRLPMLLKGRSFEQFLASYPQVNRGMDFRHDVHDWLGGWPYESISPEGVERFMGELGMRQRAAFVEGGRPLGLYGSGCDEYVYVRG